MTGLLTLHRAGPGVTLQDMGRPGYLAQGLSRGGAADPLALVEGAALLGQESGLAAIEIAGSFLSLSATVPIRIALTGAPMRARCDGQGLAWQASHHLPAGAVLDLQAGAGGYSYVHVGGGVAVDRVLGGRSAHLAAGIGRMLAAGDDLPVAGDDGGAAGLTLDPLARFDGGELRVVDTPQTRMFPAADLVRFAATTFRKDRRGNRMGQRLLPDGGGFALQAGLTVLSETIVPGDIQMTGDGMPFVLLAECQTTGGYPRIATVLPCDLPRLVQAPAEAALRFRFVALDEAVALERAEAARRAALRGTLRPLIRDPAGMADLLRYQLIGGVTRGDDLDRTAG